MLTDATGSGNVVRYDYEPFGMEISAGTNGRTTAMGYLGSPDSASLKYTGQYRDLETGLDVFPARTFSNAQGRFQMVDPGNAGAGLLDPQTWNGYGYVGNNPLTYTDPSGMFECATCMGISTGNPIGAVIGGLIDLGEILGAWLGGGCGPPPLPNWSSTAWGVGPDQTTPGIGIGSPNDEPWSEQPPMGSSSAGSLNNGTIFSAIPSNTLKGNLQSQLRYDVWLARAIGFLLRFTGPAGYAIGTNSFVYHMEKPGGTWDFKDQPRTGEHPELDDFGNCHFGAVSRAIGLPDGYARWAAGLASYAYFHSKGKTPPAENKTPWSGAPWGDKPSNQVQIRIGQETGNCIP